MKAFYKNFKVTSYYTDDTMIVDFNVLFILGGEDCCSFSMNFEL